METSPSLALFGRRRGGHNWSSQQEPRPQQPCSPAAPDPSPTRDGKTGLLQPGAKVEVRLDDKGYYGVWCQATVVEFTAAHGRNASARYSVTFGGNGNVRQFAPTHVRPRPPALNSPPRFRPQHIVEVLHERGWWPGLVLSTNPGSVTVAFPITREVIAYMPSLVRPRLDYVDGDWIPSQAVVALRPDREIRRYKVGDEVEVVRERKAYGRSWFPAKVAKVVDEFSYVVEYSHQNGEEGGGPEYLHWQFIRPAVQHLAEENEVHLHLGPGAAVEAYCDGAWSAGLVDMIHEDGKFVVRINGRRGKKQLMTKEVKPLYKWDGMNWSIVSTKRKANFKQALASGKRPKSHVEVPFNGEEHIHDAEYPSSKRSMSAQQKQAVQDSENALVSKMGTPLSASEICLTSTCPPNSCSPLYGHSAQPKIVVSDNVQNQLKRKNVPLLRKVLSSKRLSKHEGFEGPHILHGPREFSSMGQMIGVNERAGSQGEPSDVEDMDVLKEFPQQPHFIPLQQYPETIQKGMKLGLKLSFNDCVRRIRKSSITDSEGSFEEKKSTLAELKKNGFDVQYVECLLDKLIKVKGEYNKHLEEKSAVQADHERTMCSFSRNDSLLSEKEKHIVELEKKLGFLRQEAQHFEKEREQDEDNLSRLEVVESNINEKLHEHVQQFNGILAEGQQKRLN